LLELPLRPVAHDLRGGATPALAVHTHVERAVLPKAKASLRRVELAGRDAQVQQHPVYRRARVLLGERREPGEVAFRRREAPFLPRLRQPPPRLAERLAVTVEADDAPLGAEGVQERRRVAPAAERGVEVRAGRVGDEPPRDRLRHHRRVVGGGIRATRARFLAMFVGFAHVVSRGSRGLPARRPVAPATQRDIQLRGRSGRKRGHRRFGVACAVRSAAQSNVQNPKLKIATRS
jgi:hypothetical protein